MLVQQMMRTFPHMYVQNMANGASFHMYVQNMTNGEQMMRTFPICMSGTWQMVLTFSLMYVHRISSIAYFLSCVYAQHTKAFTFSHIYVRNMPNIAYVF